MTLTNEGCAFAADLTDAFDRLAAAVDRFDLPGKSKQLVVSCDVAFAALWLVPRLKRFLGAHPDIELVIDPNTNSSITPRVKRTSAFAMAVVIGKASRPSCCLTRVSGQSAARKCGPERRSSGRKD